MIPGMEPSMVTTTWAVVASRVGPRMRCICGLRVKGALRAVFLSMFMELLAGMGIGVVVAAPVRTLGRSIPANGTSAVGVVIRE